MTDPTDGFQFSRTQRSLPMALLRARELLMERFRPMLSAHGVTEQQWRVLRVLHESEGTLKFKIADEYQNYPNKPSIQYSNYIQDTPQIFVQDSKCSHRRYH